MGTLAVKELILKYLNNKVCGESIITTIILLHHTIYYCNAVTCRICRKFCDQLVATLLTPGRTARAALLIFWGFEFKVILFFG